MPKKGPKPLPSALRMLHGQTRAGQQVNHHRPLPKGKPTCPAELSPTAQRLWKRIQQSMPPDLYSRVDEAALAAFSTAYAELLQATVTIEKEGRVLVDRYDRYYEHPAMRQLARCADLIVKLGDRLGLSPTARDALKLPEQATETWEGLLS